MTDSLQCMHGFNFWLYYLLLHRRDIKVAYAFCIMQVSGTFCIMWPIVFNNVTNA